MSSQEKFRTFLASALKFDSEEKRSQIVADVEGLMTDFIRARIDPAFVLYAAEGPTSKGDWYLNVRQKLSTQPSLVAGYDSDRLKVVLKHYANFVQSKFFTSNKATLAAGELTLKATAKMAKKKEAEPVADVLGGQVPSAEDLSEGALTQVSYSKHERNPALRRLCLKHFGASCQACGMKFEAVYGEIGKGYIEVHHLNPISQTGGAHSVDPVKDLVPLCANCHAMIHRLMSDEKKTSGAEMEGSLALVKLKALVGGRKNG